MLDGSSFIKTGPVSALPMFEAEADGLKELRKAAVIRVPDVISCGISEGKSYIALERLSLQRPDVMIERRFGEQLANLHRHTAAKFGWFRDNTIGPTPQINSQSDDWPAFFREHRLQYQFDLAARNGFSSDLAEPGSRLAERLADLFVGYEPVASLLHGDLWGGNWGCADGEAVIFDPAVYYGDRETDIAMTKLFGGFGPAFYAAYAASWPLEPGHEQRLKLYQLYHVLNHLNIFGRSYLGQAKQLISDLV
jgi:protein-ribulosamine 3-kinase